MIKHMGLTYRRFTPWVHLLFWLAFFLVPLFFIESEVSRERFMYLGWFLQFLMVCYFYFNYLYLIPRVLLREKIALFLLLLFIGMVVVCALNALFTYITFEVIPHRHSFDFWRTFRGTIYPSLFIITLSSAIRITNEWFKNERNKSKLEAEKLSSDLAFLKSQINPHFLFNILNSICSLARKKSDDTENAIIKLSQIMRYMLQDSKDEKVSLEKEIEYLESYIELQHLRISEQVKISFDIEGRPEQFTIEPLLLIPFVENAFKHGISYYEHSNIEIRLVLKNKSLLFTVKNNIVRHMDETLEPGSGIGLKNVTRRLELLYPDAHMLRIEDNGAIYKVELSIQF